MLSGSTRIIQILACPQCWSQVKVAEQERVLRIAHVVETMHVGGAEVLVALLCRMQRAQGCTPAVHCIFARGRIAEELACEGFPVHLHGPASRWTMMRKLYRAFATDRPDIVHLHNATPTILGAAPARLAGVKCAISTRHGLVPPPYSWKREVQFSLAARFCNFVVAVCKTAERNLAGAPLAARRKIVTVLNGAVAQPLDGTGGPEERQPGFTLVTVGRLVPEKD
ncbi:MAG TPA: glycosyltransferase, partial [Terriglobales bacterium]